MSNTQMDLEVADVSREISPVAGLKRRGTVVLVPQPTEDPQDPLVGCLLNSLTLPSGRVTIITVGLTNGRRIGPKAGSTAFWPLFAWLASPVSPRLWQINWVLSLKRSSMERL